MSAHLRAGLAVLGLIVAGSRMEAQGEPASQSNDAASGAATSPGHAKILSVQRIWASDMSNEFTDLIRYRDRWFCSFREGTKHESPDGRVRIFESKDGLAWEPAALLQEAGVDLRDPKFSVTPDGRLMLVMGGSIMKDEEYVDRQTRVAFSSDGRSWGILHKIIERGHWLWRVTWRQGVAYGVSYLGGGGLRGVKRAGFLYRSADGLKWDLVTQLNLPGASETTLRFLDSGEMIAFSRSTVAGLGTRIGSSFPPYLEWSWKDFPQDLGGPNFIVLPDGRWVAATRFRLEDGQSKTKLAWLTRDRLDFFLEFESRRSTSYPGLVWHDGELWVSYHSSHETKTSSIYVARVQLPPAR